VNHDEAQTLWLLASEGTLEPGRREALDAHLDGCPECRAAIERLAAADRSLREWGSARMPAPEPAPLPAPIVSRTWWPVALAAGLAGITIGLAGGFAAGRQGGPEPSIPVAPVPAPDSLRQFVLLLEEPVTGWPPSTPLMRPGYFEWMDSLTMRGQFADGIRLAEDEGWYLPAGGTAVPANSRAATSANYSGLFVIRARDYDEAIAIARGSPHLAWGGVLIRRTF
jgi:hypothetical protein